MSYTNANIDKVLILLLFVVFSLLLHAERGGGKQYTPVSYVNDKQYLITFLKKEGEIYGDRYKI